MDRRVHDKTAVLPSEPSKGAARSPRGLNVTTTQSRPTTELQDESKAYACEKCESLNRACDSHRLEAPKANVSGKRRPTKAEREGEKERAIKSAARRLASVLIAQVEEETSPLPRSRRLSAAPGNQKTHDSSRTPPTRYVSNTDRPSRLPIPRATVKDPIDWPEPDVDKTLDLKEASGQGTLSGHSDESYRERKVVRAPAVRTLKEVIGKHQSTRDPRPGTRDGTSVPGPTYESRDVLDLSPLPRPSQPQAKPMQTERPRYAVPQETRANGHGVRHRRDARPGRHGDENRIREAAGIATTRLESANRQIGPRSEDSTSSPATNPDINSPGGSPKKLRRVKALPSSSPASLGAGKYFNIIPDEFGRLSAESNLENFKGQISYQRETSNFAASTVLSWNSSVTHAIARDTAPASPSSNLELTGPQDCSPASRLGKPLSRTPESPSSSTRSFKPQLPSSGARSSVRSHKPGQSNQRTKSEKTDLSPQDQKSSRVRKPSGLASNGQGDGADGSLTRGGSRRAQPPRSARPAKSFACPFVKHDESRYEHVYNPCTFPPGLESKRITEHLRRVHSVKHSSACIWCGKRWPPSVDPVQAFETHKQQCPVHNTPEELERPEPMFPAQCLALEREGRFRGDPEQRWAQVYRLLFPGDPLPSPEYDYYIRNDARRSQRPTQSSGSSQGPHTPTFPPGTTIDNPPPLGFPCVPGLPGAPYGQLGSMSQAQYPGSYSAFGTDNLAWGMLNAPDSNESYGSYMNPDQYYDPSSENMPPGGASDPTWPSWQQRQ